jgi:predicted metalloendopeptidase
VIWGVNAAYDGLQLYLKENGNLGLIDGYTRATFLYFWSTIWRTKSRDEAIKNQVKNRSTFSRNVPFLRTITKHRQLLSGIRYSIK